MNMVLAAMESSWTTFTFSLVELPWNVGLNSLMSPGLSGAWTCHLLVKFSILIGLFCTIVILNTNPSIGNEGGGSIRLIYVSTSKTTRGEGLFFPQSDMWSYSDCTMWNSPHESDHTCTCLRPVQWDVPIHHGLRCWGNARLLQEFLNTYPHFQYSSNHGWVISSFLTGIVRRPHFG